MIKTILFVCTGNTCRSAMAQGIFKKMLKEKKEDERKYNILSAGISAISGANASPEAILVMSEQAIDISQHKAARLGENLVKKADLILVMSNEHKDYISKKYPFPEKKVFLIKKYAIKDNIKYIRDNYKNYDIKDPIGRSIEFYRIVAQELKNNLEKIINKIIIDKNY